MELSEWEICVDESGIGCLAGPLTVGAVLWKKDEYEKYECKKWIRDSKKLSKYRRKKILPEIQEKLLGYSVKKATNDDIDNYGVHNAKKYAFKKAIDEVLEIAKSKNIKPVRISVDGIDFNDYDGMKHICIPHGDDLHKGISMASILAKSERDKIMGELSKEHPEYYWEKNAGYATKQHRDAIKVHGITKYHRKTFGSCKIQEYSFTD
tara:strand:+ start:922 stop:1545 length:624 start_codon:yes stop_codon:yes gene_type:complete